MAFSFLFVSARQYGVWYERRKGKAGQRKAASRLETAWEDRKLPGSIDRYSTECLSSLYVCEWRRTEGGRLHPFFRENNRHFPEDPTFPPPGRLLDRLAVDAGIEQNARTGSRARLRETNKSDSAKERMPLL